MSKGQGANSRARKHGDDNVLDERDLESVAVTSGSSGCATLVSENNPSNKTQKTKQKRLSNTKEADSELSSTNVCPQSVQDGEPASAKPARGDVKEGSDINPSQIQGAMPKSKKEKGMDHLADCEDLSEYMVGKDGHIKRYTSPVTGIIEFKFRGKLKEASFDRSAVLISRKEKNTSLEYIMTVGKLVHFNADVSACSCKKDVKIHVTDLWSGKKGKNKKGGSRTIPCKFEITETLHHGPVYKATVIEIPNPFKFVAEVDNPTVQVLVYNDRFSPSAREPPLSEKDRVTSYISVGDKVSLIAQKFSSYSKQNWMATEAWIEDEDFELNKLNNSQKKKKKGKKPDQSLMTEEKVLEGEVYRVERSWGMLLCKNENLIVIFHSRTLRLFGVPAEGIHLNHLKLSGESINFVLEENNGDSKTSTAQRAWLGSWESVSTQGEVIQRSMQLVEFCKTKDLDQQVALHLAERLASQRSQIKKAEGKKYKYSPEENEDNFEEKPFLENISKGIICPDTNNVDEVEDDEQSSMINDKEACSIDNNAENENYTVDSETESSPCGVTTSMQKEDDLTDEDIQILAQGIKGIVESQLSSVLQKLRIDDASDDMKIEVCKIMKDELINMIEGDYLEQSMGISQTHSTRNVALQEKSVSDASSQTISTGAVMFWEVTTDV